jgi:hypothetical protein
MTYRVWRLSMQRDADLLPELGGCDERSVAQYKRAPSADLDKVRDALRVLGWDGEFSHSPLVLP